MAAIVGTLHPFPGISVRNGNEPEADKPDRAFVEATVTAFAETLRAVEQGEITNVVILWTGAETFGATPVKGEAFDVSGMLAATLRLQKALVEACDEP